MKYEDEEAKLLAKEAYALWRELAIERANPYSDHQMSLVAGRMAVDATRWEDGFTILDAIRNRLDAKSSPRWIPEWARDLGGEKRKQQHNDRMVQAERNREDMDPEVRRILVAFGRAKSKNMNVTTESWTCCECKSGLTDGRCPTCRRAVHPRACQSRHECVA